MPEFFDNHKLSIDHKRDRTISESVRMKSIPKSPSRSDMMKRNRSTPGLGRLARLDSMNEREVMQVLDRRNSSYLVYEVQVRLRKIRISSFLKSSNFSEWITTSFETFSF